MELQRRLDSQHNQIIQEQRNQEISRKELERQRQSIRAREEELQHRQREIARQQSLRNVQPAPIAQQPPQQTNLSTQEDRDLQQAIDNSIVTAREEEQSRAQNLPDQLEVQIQNNSNQDNDEYNDNAYRRLSL